jgi:hypothetical protein
MPTVIDSFVVELGLDPSKFTAQQKVAFDAAKKLEAQQLASAKNIEHASNRVTEAIGGIRTQALELFAIFAGGKGVLEFGKHLTTANAQLGRLERNIGVSASTINAWQGAARIFGGSAEQMAQSFTSVSDAFAGWKIGIISPMVADLRAISTAGGKIIDVNKGVEQSFLDLSANLQKIHNSGPDGPAQAGVLGRRLGLDPALFDLLVQGPASVQKVLDYVKKIGVATKEDTDAFGELEKRISQMGVKAESLGRKFLGGKGGGASMIIEAADLLNMTPAEAWAYLNRTDRKGLGQNRGDGQGSGPGSNLFPSGAFTSQADKEAFIRSEAAKRGINPNTAMSVARSEGFNTFKSSIPGEESYSAFQLHVTPGGRGGHVGDQFRAQTGLDPSDKANERNAIVFALDDVKRTGWVHYHGAKNTGIGPWEGIDRSSGGSSSTTEVNINGPITVTAPAGSEPETFANRFAAAVKRQSYAAQANNGAN